MCLIANPYKAKHLCITLELPPSKVPFLLLSIYIFKEGRGRRRGEKREREEGRRESERKGEEEG